MTAVKMSLRTCATLTLLLGLVMWIFNLTALVSIHIVLAVLVLVLSITWLVMSASATGNNSTIRMLQIVIVVVTLCTMVAGYYQGSLGAPAGNIVHLILGLGLVGLIETTMARQKRVALAVEQRA